MNLTNTKKLEKFWEEQLGPALENLQLRQKDLLDYQKTGSSWEKPADEIPDLCELSQSQIENELKTRFNADQLFELAEIVPDLMKLAREIRPTNDQAKELDEFVYVMY